MSTGGLPRDRAFVVQIAADVRLDADLAGRVEHVASGRAVRFATTTELLAFLAVFVGDASHAAHADPHSTATPPAPPVAAGRTIPPGDGPTPRKERP